MVALPLLLAPLLLALVAAPVGERRPPPPSWLHVAATSAPREAPRPGEGLRIRPSVSLLLPKLEGSRGGTGAVIGISGSF
jgi:hypothetical protein